MHARPSHTAPSWQQLRDMRANPPAWFVLLAILTLYMLGMLNLKPPPYHWRHSDVLPIYESLAIYQNRVFQVGRELSAYLIDLGQNILPRHCQDGLPILNTWGGWVCVALCKAFNNILHLYSTMKPYKFISNSDEPDLPFCRYCLKMYWKWNLR